MNKPWTIIAELAATDSKNEKQAILNREAIAGNDVLFRGLRACFDSMITFGVKKVESKPVKRASEPEPKGVNPEKFDELCTKLAMRELTGDAAKVAINYVMNQATEEEWNGWYRLILMKDMKAGFSESTVNKVCEKKFPQYAITVFETQLAFDGANHPEKVSGKKLLESKMDGLRLVSVVYPDGKVTQYSRNGKEMVNFEVVRQQLSKTAMFFAEPVVLDGEIMSTSFQDLMKQARRKTNVQADDSILHLFDIITLKEFQAGIGNHRQIDRSHSLGVWFENLKDQMPNIEVVGQELVDLDTSEGQLRFAEINKAALAGGYEGIMIKDPEAVYECKRNVAWLKRKPTISVDLTVVAVEEGKAETKNVGKLGALVCEGVDQGKNIRVNVGSGFTDAQRQEFWDNASVLIGQTVEVMADVITKSQDSDTYSLRFPRFLRFRDDK